MSDKYATQTVAPAVMQVFLQLADDMNVASDLLAAETDIPPARLENGEQRVPVEAVYRLTRQVARLTASDDIGLWAGRVNFLNQTSLLRYLSEICTHFRQWLNMIPSTLETLGDIGETVVVRQGDTLCTQWRPTAPLEISDRYIIDMILSMSQCMLDAVCYTPVQVSSVSFTYPEPADTSVHRQIFGDQLRFDQAFSGLSYPAEALEYRILKVGDAGPASMAGNLAGVIEKVGSDAFVRRLRRCIIRALPSGTMTIDSIASELAISRRTLQRRLAERGLLFGGIVQELRSDMAVRLLVDKQIPVTEIAFMLGYADSSSFSAAFKSWHRCSPREYAERA